MAPEGCMVYVTCGSREEAERIALAVVDERLAACANILSDVASIYRWEGEVQREAEWLMLLKTRPDKLDALERRVKELHSYTVPEFIVVPLLSGSSEYLLWLTQCVS